MIQALSKIHDPVSRLGNAWQPAFEFSISRKVGSNDYNINFSDNDLIMNVTLSMELFKIIKIICTMRHGFAGVRQVTRLYSKKVTEPMPHHKMAQHTRTTINDYPVPKGSWHVNYAARQNRMNRQLALAAGLFLCTLVGVSKHLCLFVCFYK